MVVFSDFYESHEPTLLGDARGIVPPHRDGQGKCSIIFVLIVALEAAGAIRSE